ncbi:MAG: PIN domain-containing protein [Anaerolineae bacterium]|nr:PIN domain-containing protein [Anaerolineae bacterium]
MTVGIVDTTVILHLFRNYGDARAWVDSQPARLSIVSISWMEVMEGANSKATQAQCKTILERFEVVYPTSSDQQWAMQQLERFQFSHHIGKDDCLIASVAYRLQRPLYTHNLKDMTPLIGSLAVKPYA